MKAGNDIFDLVVNRGERKALLCPELVLMSLRYLLLRIGPLKSKRRHLHLQVIKESLARFH